MKNNTSKCTNPKLQKLVSLYELNLLPDKLKTTVEAHLLECPACFGELYHFSALTDMIEAKPVLFDEALQLRPTFAERWLLFFKTVRFTLKKYLQLTFSMPIPTGIKFGIKILVPITATAMLVLLLFHLAQPQYTDLARIEHAPYQPLFLRSPQISPPIKRLFEDGMERYNCRDYPTAILKLTAYTESQPNDALAYFHLGVCWLLQNQMAKGIETLLQAKTLSQQQQLQILFDRCTWYLGNAYLKLNKPELAVSEFQKIATSKSELVEDALQQLAQIQIRQKGE